MPSIESLVLPPPANQLTLFGYLIILVTFLHITFISVFLGSSLLSVIFNILDKRQPNPKYSRFAKDLLETGIYNKSFGVILGLLPLMTLSVLFSQILYGSGLPIHTFFNSAFFFLALGLILIYMYQHTFPQRDKQFLLHICWGILGLAVLFGAYFIFIGGTTLITDFEKRSFIQRPDPYSLLFSWSVIARYKIFLFASLAITGGAALFYFFEFYEDSDSIDEDYGAFLRKFCAGLSLACIAILPVMMVWNLITLPVIALSAKVFVMTSLSIMLFVAIFYLLYGILMHGVRPHAVLHKEGAPYKSRLMFYDKSKSVVHVLILFILAFSVISISDQITVENAIRDHTLNLVVQADEARKKLLAEAEKKRSAEAVHDKAGGEKIFNSRCTACHLYDKKLVGPSFNTVLPKYESNPDELIAFIQSPTKKDPGYPPMPNYGLNRSEASGVASYILKRLKGEVSK